MFLYLDEISKFKVFSCKFQFGGIFLVGISNISKEEVVHYGARVYHIKIEQKENWKIYM